MLKETLSLSAYGGTWAGTRYSEHRGKGDHRWLLRGQEGLSAGRAHSYPGPRDKRREYLMGPQQNCGHRWGATVLGAGRGDRKRKSS